MLTPLTILMLIGVIKKSVNLVFPFICIHFVIILMMICHICKLLIESAFLRFAQTDDITTLISETICILLMIYFFMVVFAFYHGLLQEQWISSLTTNDKIDEEQPNNIENSENIENPEDIENNLDYDEPKEINSDKMVNLQYDNFKQSTA